ncbi:MAG TPA: hypothetical protein VHN79_11655 [Lacunisphaera sp.]|nr:hypothetical protein [Lacunisphaera sp.]
MMRSPQLRRLHFLNALFAPLTGHDLYLAQQIDDAISTSIGEVEQRDPADPQFVAAAARLFERVCAGQSGHGFFHWDAGTDEAGAAPLFARAGVMQGLKQLAAYPESTLLVTNLRAAHCPPDRRWTERRRREYQASLSLIRDLAAARSRRSASLNLLFL